MLQNVAIPGHLPTEQLWVWHNLMKLWKTKCFNDFFLQLIILHPVIVMNALLNNSVGSVHHNGNDHRV